MQLQYPDIAALEADVKLLIFNAKQYYKKNSSTFDDAERVRKMLSDFVRKNLPRNGSIGSPITPRAFAPGSSTGRSYNRKRKKYDEDGDGEIDADGEVNGNEDEFGEPATKRPRLDDMSQEFDMNGTSESIDESVEEHSNWPNYSSSDFKDCSMQAAQEIIVKECKTLVDAECVSTVRLILVLVLTLFCSGDNFTAIFHDRPSRKLFDYYQLIKRPVSLNSIRKQVAGVQSRGESTGRSTFKYWEDFEKEMELIWLNAREYNEDDSQITKDSYILEVSQTSSSLPPSYRTTTDKSFFRTSSTPESGKPNATCPTHPVQP